MTEPVRESNMESGPVDNDSKNGSEDEVIVPFTGGASGSDPESLRNVNRYPDGTVRGIRKRATDFHGEKVEHVFFKRSHYAIYKAGSKVAIQLSDDDVLATKQVAEIANLLPLRDKLQYLAAGIYNPHSCYYGQIAEAIRLGLEGQAEVGKKILDEAVDNAMSIRERNGRICYLKVAGYVAAAFVTMIVCMTLFLPPGQNDIVAALSASGAGSIGALLSIAIGIRSRTVAIDGDARANFMEAFGRILIGVISAAALVLIVISNAKNVPDPSTAEYWRFALLIGFAGGFLERLVPDLLQRSVARVTT
jgi:hypothetical protein